MGVRVLFRRVPYYLGDLKGDPSLENYPSKDCTGDDTSSGGLFETSDVSGLPNNRVPF